MHGHGNHPCVPSRQGLGCSGRDAAKAEGVSLVCKQMIVQGCRDLAARIGSKRTMDELLPHCWEQMNDKVRAGGGGSTEPGEHRHLRSLPAARRFLLSVTSELPSRCSIRSGVSLWRRPAAISPLTSASRFVSL